MVLIFAEALLKCMGTTRLKDIKTTSASYSPDGISRLEEIEVRNCLEPLEQGWKPWSLAKPSPACVAWPVSEGWCFLMVKKIQRQLLFHDM